MTPRQFANGLLANLILARPGFSKPVRVLRIQLREAHDGEELGAKVHREAGKHATAPRPGVLSVNDGGPDGPPQRADFGLDPSLHDESCFVRAVDDEGQGARTP